MNRMPSSRRLTFAGMVAASAALGLAIAFRLAMYDVPVSLLFACSMSCTASALFLLLRLADAVGTSTHRCTVAGCDFQVRMRHVDAAENRKWQEIAATHPHRAA